MSSKYDNIGTAAELVSEVPGPGHLRPHPD